MRKIKGFTLSEVLITLLIIGIIAVITVPVIQAQYNEKERVSKIKKVYSTLANAMTMVKAAGGDMEFEVVETKMYQWFNDYLAKNLSYTKVCVSKAGCWNSGDTKFLNGSIAYANRKGIGIGGNIVTVILNDGTFLNIDAYNSTDLLRYLHIDTKGGWGIVIIFDINGEKGPNTVGKDIFYTMWTENGFIPAYRDATQQEKEIDCTSKGTGVSCLNMYLAKL